MDQRTRIEEVIATLVHRRADGKPLSDEEVCAAHPELRPQLDEELSKLRRIRAAREAALASESVRPGTELEVDSEAAVTITTPGPTPEIPDYEASQRIGRGGFGAVWLARNRPTGQLYAIKIIPISHQVELEGIREYKKRSGSHPHLLPIEHVGVMPDGQSFYYTMPPADAAPGTGLVGEFRDYEPLTLQKLLQSNHAPLPPAQTIDIAVQLLAALDHLHRAGLIHKDVKPANVLRVQGVWQMGDMGLVCDSNRVSWEAGTRGFRPPEGAMDQTADLYALGKTLFLLSTGLELSAFADYAAGRTELPVDPVAQQLRAILLKACAEDPVQRYPSAAQMRQDLARLQKPHGPRRRRRRWWVAAGFAALLLAASVSYLIFIKPLPPPVYVLSMDVDAYRGDPPQLLGRMGLDCTACNFGDLVDVSAHLSEPAYTYLLTFTPDGHDHRLLAAKTKDGPPPKSTQLTGKWRVDDGVGRQFFAVVVSREPLPSYAQWKTRHPPIPWKTAVGEGVWSYSDGRLERLDRSRSAVETSDLPVGVHQLLVEICEGLRARPGVVAVRGLALPVRPHPWMWAVTTAALGAQPPSTTPLCLSAALVGSIIMPAQPTPVAMSWK